MSEKVTLSPGEKLILLMLSDVIDHLEIKTDTDTKLLREAIFSGNLWGLEWGMSGVFHGHETPTAVVDETANILTMWEKLEQSYEALSQADKDSVATQASLSSSDVVFPGFDGNDESEYLSAARFLIEELDRFSRFKKRKDLNSHLPTLEADRRMYAVFEPILMQALNKDFSATQIAPVLAAWRSPGPEPVHNS